MRAIGSSPALFQALNLDEPTQDRAREARRSDEHSAVGAPARRTFRGWTSGERQSRALTLAKVSSMASMVDDEEDEVEPAEPEKPEQTFAPARSGMKHARTMPELARKADAAASARELEPKKTPDQGAAAAPSPQPCCCATLANLTSALLGPRKELPRVVPPRRSHMESSPDGPVVVFDWDDTLMPTSFVMEKVIPLYRDQPVPEGALHYDKLAAHANIVRRMLRSARQVARVAVVTLARRPWVSMSGALYFPGEEGIEELLACLEIPVYYASEHLEKMTLSIKEKKWVAEVDRSGGGRVGMGVHQEDDGTLTVSSVSDEGLIAEWNRAHPEQAICPGDRFVDLRRPDGAPPVQEPEGMLNRIRVPAKVLLTVVREVPESDPFVDSKRMSMDAALGKLYGSSAKRWNAISIGDSPAEHAAMRQAAGPERAPRGSLCKTVDLVQQPTVEELSSELRILLAWLPRIVNHEKNFDLEISKLELL